MNPPPGWYPDPEQPESYRWWNGQEWTADRSSGAALPAQSYPVYLQPQIPGADKKVPAGVLGILLGGFGIHRFYLDDAQGGILRIVITVFTCGLGSIIGLIEGIIYLTKSDAEFVQTYLVERKEWF